MYVSKMFCLKHNAYFILHVQHLSIQRPLQIPVLSRLIADRVKWILFSFCENNTTQVWDVSVLTTFRLRTWGGRI